MMREFVSGLGFGLLVVLLGVLALGWYCLWVPGNSHSGPLPPLTPEEKALAGRLRAHIATIAAEPHNAANIGALRKVEAYITRILEEEGYRVRRQAFQADDLEVANLEAVIEPINPAQRTLVIGAHYDSAGSAPGANDNASGSAAVLELARSLKNHKPNLTRLRLVLFVNEEPPHFKTETMGSLVYARWLAAQREPVIGMLCLETLGFFSDRPGSQTYPPLLDRVYPDRADFIAIAGPLSARSFGHEVISSFRRHAAFPTIGGVLPSFVPGVDWSDHWSFGQVGYPAVMVTDTALYRYPYYHTAEDTVDKVDAEALARITLGLDRVTRELAP